MWLAAAGFPTISRLPQQSGLCALTNISCLLGCNEQTRARVTTASSHYEESLQTIALLVSSPEWGQPDCCSCQLDFKALFFPYFKGQCEEWWWPAKGSGGWADKGRPRLWWLPELSSIISNWLTPTVTRLLFVVKAENGVPFCARCWDKFLYFSYSWNV